MTLVTIERLLDVLDEARCGILKEKEEALTNMHLYGARGYETCRYMSELKVLYFTNWLRILDKTEKLYRRTLDIDRLL